MKKISHNFFILPLILFVSVAIVVFLVKTKTPVEHQDTGYPVKAVEVITAGRIPFRARAVVFGHVEPTVVLNAKSEVSGKISFIYPDLKKGASIPQGTVVLKIDPNPFEFSLAESKAALANSQSSLAQLETEEKSTRDSLVIVQNNLNVELEELERIKVLKEKGIVSQSELDKEKQKVLALRQQLQDVEGRMAGFDSRRAAIQAQIKQSESVVHKSQDTLGKTEIRLPFDARIGAVSVDKGEFVQPGSSLFEALDTQSVEINAQISTKQLRPLVTGLQIGKEMTVDLRDSLVLQSLVSNMMLEARIRLVADDSHLAMWDGTVVRIGESVDPVRDTLGLVVAVDKPYEGIIPGIRPPLLKGMYVSVEFLAPAKPSLVVPRKAVHQGRVYVSSEENTLAIRPVTTLFTQDDLVVIADESEAGVNVGEKIIISDVIPVMEGMPLKPLYAADYEERLKQAALGNHGISSYK